MSTPPPRAVATALASQLVIVLVERVTVDPSATYIPPPYAEPEEAVAAQLVKSQPEMVAVASVTNTAPPVAAVPDALQRMTLTPSTLAVVPAASTVSAPPEADAALATQSMIEPPVSESVAAPLTAIAPASGAVQPRMVVSLTVPTEPPLRYKNPEAVWAVQLSTVQPANDICAPSAMATPP
eukprot:7256486-Prymnesium_polylepis.1